jgi:hypothetical protein
LTEVDVRLLVPLGMSSPWLPAWVADKWSLIRGGSLTVFSPRGAGAGWNGAGGGGVATAAGRGCGDGWRGG